MRAVDVDAFGDEAAQEAQIRQRDRDQQRAALVALIGAGRGVRIAAAIERREREIDLARARGAEQRRVEIGAVDAGGEIGRGGVAAFSGCAFRAGARGARRRARRAGSD